MGAPITGFQCACLVMVCFLGLQVEKNEEADQKIEQDGTANKPEDKAHKAATKIQASFRGHITRKKMKDGEKEKDGDSPAAAEEATEGGEEVQKAEGEKKVNGEVAPEEGEVKKEQEASQTKSPVAEKPANSPAAPPTTEPQKQEPKPEVKPEEKPKEAETKSPTTAAAEEKKEEKEQSEEKQEEARQADVPAAVSQTAEEEEPNQTKDQAGTLTPGPATQIHNRTSNSTQIRSWRDWHSKFSRRTHAVSFLCSRKRVRQVIIDRIQSVVGGRVPQYRIKRKVGHLGSAVSLLS